MPSTVHTDHGLSTAALRRAPAPEALEASRTTILPFDPVRDGFSFANSFVWTDDDLAHLAKRLRPLSALAFAAAGGAGGRLAGKKTSAAGVIAGGGAAAFGLGDGLVRAVARRWRTFGLCGGMSLAAVERWPARGRTPTSALEQDTMRPLFRRRQAETLRASMSRFVRAWARARLDGTAHPPLGRSLVREVERAAAQIEAGRPVVLGVVGDAPDPFSNHQVVAFGVERGAAAGEATFHIYDPNAPGVTRVIRTALLASDPRRTRVMTDIPTGPRASGRCHLATRPNWLATVLVVM